MPSFDVVSEVNSHELTNAIDQATRELTTRYDFRGVDASIEQEGEEIKFTAEADFQLKQMQDILQIKMVKRGIDIKCLDEKDSYPSGKQVKQTLCIRQGMDKDLSKKIVKVIKESKLKVQSSIQGEKVRITGKKRDDLQEVIALLKEGNFDLPLQFDNFRD